MIDIGAVGKNTKGRGLRERVLVPIRGGAGEDFLQGDFEAGQLAPLEDMHDQKGFKIFDERFDFPGGDTFEAIDFSHADFYHSTFNNAVFNCYVGFARIYNCEFRRCIFSFNHAYGTTFEKCRFIECDFVEGDTFTNCRFRDSTFDDCFIPVRMFFDRSPRSVHPRRPVGPGAVSDEPDCSGPEDRTDIYNGIKEAYRAGGVPEKVRDRFFCRCRRPQVYNVASRGERWLGFVKA